MGSIGENIKKLRIDNGMSQTELAERIGKTRGAVGQYETGKIVPRMGVVEKLSRVFDVPKSAIIETTANYSAVNLPLVSDDEAELLEMYRRLPNRARRALLAGLREYGIK